MSLDPALEHPVKRTKPTRNDGASHAYPDDEVLETDSEREEELGVKNIRPPRHISKYVVVNGQVTGERAKLDEDQIRSKLDAETRLLMEFYEQRFFWDTNHFQPTKASGSSKTRMRTDAASLMTYIAVQCSVSVSARSVVEL